MKRTQRARRQVSAAPVAAPAAPKRTGVSHMALMQAAPQESSRAFTIAKPMAGVVPAGRIAMDDAGFGASTMYGALMQSLYDEGQAFMGYPALAQLTQRSEYRRPAEILAKHMTRKWLRLQAKGEEDKTDKIDAIEEEFKRLNVQGVFRKAIELDGFFGRAQIYIDTGAEFTDRAELMSALRLTPNKIGKGALKALTVIEPVWTYPNQYNSTNPLAPDFYQPRSWFVLGSEIHSSRLLTIIGRQVPDILKPAYAFGGLSLSQMAKPYVDNWLRTRQSVSDLIHSFSVSGLKTNLGSILQGGQGADVANRVALFNQHRDNRGMLIVDKDTEEFFNVSTPLSGLDHLQAQSQEHMSAVTGIPLSILLGITPTGLNASSEGEIRTFFDWVEAQQEGHLTPCVEYVLRVVQLSLFGEIDPDIGFAWEPLWSMDAGEAATVRKTDADTDVVLINAGVISPEESRQRVAADEDSPYAGLDINDLPDPPQQGPDEDGPPSNADETKEPAEDPDAPAPNQTPTVGAKDAAWVEADHGRAENGQFGSGGSGESATTPTRMQTAAVTTAAKGAQAFMSQALYNEAKRTIALYAKKEKGNPLSPEQIEVATEQLERHMAAAHAAKPAYDETMERLGKELGAEVKLAKIKGGDRLLEKHVNENKSKPEKMRDLVRGSLIVKSLDDVPAAMAKVGAAFKISREKDRFTTPMSTGYRDILLNVELPGGIEGEVQIHVQEMTDAKGEIGHDLYDIQRKIPQNEAGAITDDPKDQQHHDYLTHLQTQVYGAAHAAAVHRSNLLRPVRSQSPNSSRDKTSPSMPALDALAYGLELPSDKSKETILPPPMATTGMPSTSMNLAEDGISENSISGSRESDILDPILAFDAEHWITTHPSGGGKGTPLLISGGGVVLGGAGGSLNGKTLSPSSKSAPRAEAPSSSKAATVQSALQNRNRNSAASIAQMNRIAANPNPRLLMAAPTMNDGAPVVSDLAGSGVAKLTGKRDFVVTGKREIPIRYAVVDAGDISISNRADGTKNADYAKQDDKLTAINNGRTAGVVAAYERGTADAYKAALVKGEHVHGISGKAIKAMKAPVLVRIMDAADVDEHIGDESNSTQTLNLSAVEQAQNDASRFDPSAIDYRDDGTPTDESVKGFINAMPEAERQSLSPNGRATKQAIDRMMAATFHSAYGDTELVSLMAQATDPESRNLIGGMSRAAGSMAKLKDAGELDFRELVTGAAKQIINAVRSGVSIKKFLAQGDLLTSGPEDAIAAMFAQNARSAKTIGERLDAAAKFAQAESQRGGVDMFGEQIPTATRAQILEELHAHA